MPEFFNVHLLAMPERSPAFFHLKLAVEDSTLAPSFSIVVFVFHAKSLQSYTIATYLASAPVVLQGLVRFAGTLRALCLELSAVV